MVGTGSPVAVGLYPSTSYNGNYVNWKRCLEKVKYMLNTSGRCTEI